MKDTTVCITTINRPIFLLDLFKNAKKFGHKNYNIIIIGDYKSPKDNPDYIKSLKDKFKVDINYLTVKDQKKILKKYKLLDSILPYNWGGRKMLANFLSIKQRSKITIQLDDDNFILKNDFFGSHSIVGNNVKLNLYENKNKWHNVYETLNVEKNLKIYPRGFLQKYRFKNILSTQKKKTIKIAACNGLVLNDPDIDAFTRLYWPVCVKSVKKKYLPHYGLKPDTWCTWNNQNTSTYYDLTKIYFTPASVGRNSDIWTSLVICKIASHLKETIAFGNPVVRQNRNFHDYHKDIIDESIYNIHNESFVNLLRSVTLKKNNYFNCMNELISESKYVLDSSKNKIFKKVALGYFSEYKKWLEELSRIV